MIRQKSSKSKTLVPGLRLVLEVRYPHMGRPMMMGKIFPIQRKDKTVLICLHESTDTQRLRLFDSPGGVDKIVLEALLDYRVKEYHHYLKQSGSLYVTEPEIIKSKGILQTLGGKTRYFLPENLWQKLDRIGYTVPYVTQTKTLVVIEDEIEFEE